jgi:hypothetical protein
MISVVLAQSCFSHPRHSRLPKTLTNRGALSKRYSGRPASIFVTLGRQAAMLSLDALDQIVAIDADRKVVIVKAGVGLYRLTAALVFAPARGLPRWRAGADPRRWPSGRGRDHAWHRVEQSAQARRAPELRAMDRPGGEVRRGPAGQDAAEAATGDGVGHQPLG